MLMRSAAGKRCTCVIDIILKALCLLGLSKARPEGVEEHFAKAAGVGWATASVLDNKHETCP